MDRRPIDPPYGVTVRGNGDAPLLSYHAEGNEALALLREIDQGAHDDRGPALQQP